MIVLTMGPLGAAAVLSDDGEVVTVPGRKVEVVDTVGAGDTFMAGFLSAYVSAGRSVEEALHHGVAAAALVCERAGAWPPSSEEVDECLTKGV